jgi:glycosyltransferase involved in cell wall biosynthesis
MSRQGCSVSIVIAARNVANKIENCILSALAQTHPAVEIVVVDGCSDDGTVDVLRRYSDRVQWVSEPDGGVNEAQWKGALRATGDWVLFLGADDYLACPKALERLFEACPADFSGYDIITGHALYEDGRLYRSDRLHFIHVKNCLHGQGALYRRGLFDQKKYDLSLRIYYDYEFNLWALSSGKRVWNTSILLSVLGCGGLSDRPRWRNYLEDMRVRARYVTGPALYAANLFAAMRYARKAVRFYLMRDR